MLDRHGVVQGLVQGLVQARAWCQADGERMQRMMRRDSAAARGRARPGQGSSSNPHGHLCLAITTPPPLPHHHTHNHAMHLHHCTRRVVRCPTPAQQRLHRPRLIQHIQTIRNDIFS